MAKQTFTTGQVLTAAQMTSLQQTAMGGGAATAKTASYVLVAADAGTTVAMNAAGSTTITVSHTHTATSTDSGHLHTQTEYNQPGIGNAGGGGARVNAVTANTGTGFANITTTVASAGSSGTNANYPPYITVAIWKRTV